MKGKIDYASWLKEFFFQILSYGTHVEDIPQCVCFDRSKTIPSQVQSYK